MKILIEPGNSKSVITTIAIGSPYFDDWKKYAYPLWSEYCKRHQIGLVVFDENLVDKEDPYWKKPTWQKLLIGERLKSSSLDVSNVCYLDTDVLVNPFAPNVFENWDSRCYGLVALRSNLPYPYHETLRRVAFLRHTYYDEKYPLDSALFTSLEQLYGYHDLPVMHEEACMGMILFNIDNHEEEMSSWFSLYDKNVRSITNDGDQTHMNYHIQSTGKVCWLDYRYQAIWVFEMAAKYPFLYGRLNRDTVRAECIKASLAQNYILHFAGSWHESEMWRDDRFSAPDFLDELKNFDEYRKQPVTGEPKGIIKP